jgi:PhnB protein
MSKTTLSPYLNFSGNTKTAMEHYEKVLGGNLDIQTFGQTQGMEIPSGYEDKIIHARLDSNGITIMASDPMPAQEVQVGNNVRLSLNGTNHEELSQIFDKLAQGGNITMPMAKQFWGDTFGMLTDRFGIQWMVNITKEKP